MQLQLPAQLDTRTALRYLGAAGWTPDEATVQLLARAESALRAAATPRGIWRPLPLSVLPLDTAGTDLARHLKGCTGMVLMAATLGSGVDAALRRLCLQDIALGTVADAVASVLLEQVCDSFEAEIPPPGHRYRPLHDRAVFPRLRRLPAHPAAGSLPGAGHGAGDRALPDPRLPDDPPQERHRHSGHGGPPGHRGQSRLCHLCAARKMCIPKEGNHLCN